MARSKSNENGLAPAHRLSQSTRRCLTICMATAALLSGCHFQRAYLSYPVTSGELPVHSTAIEGVAIGTVRANEGGPVWKECTRVAEGAIWVLIKQTKGLGGNAVGNLRWFPDKPRFLPQEAMCKQKWGWVLVWPILATPAFQRARVEATAYRIEEPGQESALYVIPDSPSAQAELVRRIVRDTLPVQP